MPDDRRLDAAVDTLLEAGRLKVAPRTGWALRGVPAPESVADHSHGVALAALMLCELIDEPLDRGRVLALAVLHDLPESVTGDLSLGASARLPAGVKTGLEERALADLLGDLPFAAAWRELWREFEDQASPEARLVRDADRVDLLAQALTYERTTGNRQLDEFWRFAPPDSFAYGASRRLAALLAARRPDPPAGA